MPTVTGKSTYKKNGPKRPRPARGVCEGLSCMKGNFHVQFLGEGVAATPPPYPAEGHGRRQMEQSQSSGLSAHALVRWPGPGHLTSGQEFGCEDSRCGRSPLEHTGSQVGR